MWCAALRCTRRRGSAPGVWAPVPGLGINGPRQHIRAVAGAMAAAEARRNESPGNYCASDLQNLEFRGTQRGPLELGFGDGACIIDVRAPRTKGRCGD